MGGCSSFSSNAPRARHLRAELPRRASDRVSGSGGRPLTPRPDSVRWEQNRGEAAGPPRRVRAALAPESAAILRGDRRLDGLTTSGSGVAAQGWGRAVSRSPDRHASAPALSRRPPAGQRKSAAHGRRRRQVAKGLSRSRAISANGIFGNRPNGYLSFRNSGTPAFFAASCCSNRCVGYRSLLHCREGHIDSLHPGAEPWGSWTAGSQPTRATTRPARSARPIPPRAAASDERWRGGPRRTGPLWPRRPGWLPDRPPRASR